MGALVAGQPDCGLQFEEVVGRERVVKVVMSSFYSFGVAADKLARRAAAVTALLATLNSAGYPVELVLHDTGQGLSNTNRWDNIESTVTCHTAGDVFDMARIAFWAGHPAAVRHLVYGLEAAITSTGTRDQGVNNHGLNRELADAMRNKCKTEGWVYIEPAHLDMVRGKYDTDEQAMAWIEQQLESIHKNHGDEVHA
jgi:hypothetical protein